MKERHGRYDYALRIEEDGWLYCLLNPSNPDEVLFESVDRFESSQEARFAAIGHISMLISSKERLKSLKRGGAL